MTRLVGARVVEVRRLSTRELAREGWPTDEHVLALAFDNGLVVYASRDDEGNGPGAMFGATARGHGFRVCACAPPTPARVAS
jgi:hypothetical protein